MHDIETISHLVTVVNQLAGLFRNLEYSEQAAVTPTIDLAKLALVTSQDEEEEDQGGAGTDASNDTDATLVEDGPVRALERSSPSPVNSPTRSPPSPTVLGKRNRGRASDAGVVDMEGITTAEDDRGFVVVSKSPSPRREEEKEKETQQRPKPERKGSSFKRKATTEQEDVVMKDVQQRKAPPLPPRKPAHNDSVMMFGKCCQDTWPNWGADGDLAGRQHDVSECMDNCMFQIETALLDFNEQEMAATSQSDKTSVIKRSTFLVEFR